MANMFIEEGLEHLALPISKHVERAAIERDKMGIGVPDRDFCVKVLYAEDINSMGAVKPGVLHLYMLNHLTEHKGFSRDVEYGIVSVYLEKMRKLFPDMTSPQALGIVINPKGFVRDFKKYANDSVFQDFLGRMEEYGLNPKTYKKNLIEIMNTVGRSHSRLKPFFKKDIVDRDTVRHELDHLVFFSLF